MRKLLKGIAVVTILFFVHSCGSLKNKDITGEKENKYLKQKNSRILTMFFMQLLWGNMEMKWKRRI